MKYCEITVSFSRRGYIQSKYVGDVVHQVLPLLHFPKFGGEHELYHSCSDEEGCGPAVPPFPSPRQAIVMRPRSSCSILRRQN